MIGSIAMCMKLYSFCSYIYAYLQSCGLFYTCEVTGKGYLLNIAPVWPHIVILPVTVLTWKVTRRLAFETINLFWGYQGLLSPMNKGPVQWVGWVGHQPVDRTEIYSRDQDNTNLSRSGDEPVRLIKPKRGRKDRDILSSSTIPLDLMSNGLLLVWWL